MKTSNNQMHFGSFHAGFLKSICIQCEYTKNLSVFSYRDSMQCFEHHCMLMCSYQQRGHADVA